MLNPFHQVNWKPGTAERRKFALSLIVGFPVLALVLFLIRGAPAGPVALWLAGIGVATGVVLWIAPAIARPFYVVWYGISCCIGLVVGNVVLMIFYYVGMTGIGLLVRLFKRSAITKRFDKAAPTYWQKAEPTLDSKRYYRQF